MSRDGNAPSPNDGFLKQQGGCPLSFLYHDFTSYHNTEWYQWEINVQMKATGATQSNSANTVGPKIKAFLVKLFATHGKEKVNVFSENCRRLEVENFPAAAKDVKDLLNYKTTNNQNSNVTLLLHVTGLIPFATFEGKLFNWLKLNNIYINITIFQNTKET
eukprot:10797468-Ditylum_brightwellii.AAC.1